MTGKEIHLPADASVETQQWTAAHAIGKHLEANLQQRIGLDPKESRGLKGESLANLFAGRLLVPTRWLAEESQNTGHDLFALKERFASASHEVIAWRLLDLPEPCIITVMDNDRVERRRSNAWWINRELSVPEKRCRQQMQDAGGPCEYREDGWTVQGWPLPGGDGKREVLRSVVET
jgi:Zn-dependent peptidase ImmA (M78 family)